jgi:uncharacterized membrane protein YuzA (DUF378 family)
MNKLFHNNTHNKYKSDIFGSGTLTNIVYVVIGVAGLFAIPRLLAAFHIGTGPHPRGA